MKQSYFKSNREKHADYCFKYYVHCTHKRKEGLSNGVHTSHRMSKEPTLSKLQQHKYSMLKYVSMIKVTSASLVSLRSN